MVICEFMIWRWVVRVKCHSKKGREGMMGGNAVKIRFSGKMVG